MKRLFFIIAMFLSLVAFTQTRTEIKSSVISKGITAYISQNFSGYAIDKAFKVDNKGVMSTELLISKGVEKYKLSFDKEGKLIKKEALKPELKTVPVKSDKKTVVK
jgi:hypothetical protein